jgi:hypothetical protein
MAIDEGTLNPLLQNYVQSDIDQPISSSNSQP